MLPETSDLCIHTHALVVLSLTRGVSGCGTPSGCGGHTHHTSNLTHIQTSTHDVCGKVEKATITCITVTLRNRDEEVNALR